MESFITVVHVGVALFMIIAVLLQVGKAGGGIGFGGGGSNTVFGASGSGNFLTKITTFCAITFFCTSLALTYMAGHRATESVVGDVEEVAPKAEPAPSMEPGKKDTAPEEKK